MPPDVQKQLQTLASVQIADVQLTTKIVYTSKLLGQKPTVVFDSVVKSLNPFVLGRGEKATGPAPPVPPDVQKQLQTLAGAHPKGLMAASLGSPASPCRVQGVGCRV